LLQAIKDIALRQAAQVCVPYIPGN